ncbi:MAG: nuclear transport factor 2 family protein [Anaerolineae bacterium]|nr:nuclear transport factor 2 family protein [Candidatus Roseilinea sp.]MDW8449463.1 nuclear transport factor 2 family protein [Anaerolineae bacterium]
MAEATPFDALAYAWQFGGPDHAASLCHPDATWIVDGRPYHGRAEIGAYLRSIAGAPGGVRVLVRRAFHDLREPDWWVAEWAVRVGVGDGRWREVEQGVMLCFNAGQITHLRIHNDHRSFRDVEEDAPLREEPWPPAIPPRTRDMTYDEILAVHYRHVLQGWARGDAETVVSCHAPQSVIQTSFEVVRGHDQLRRAVEAYYENYADTVVTVHRVVYSGDYLAIHQTWSCTNRKTGVRADDHDLNIGVMQDGRFWRWREYYDSTKSAQTLEQTVFGVKRADDR